MEVCLCYFVGPPAFLFCSGAVSPAMLPNAVLLSSFDSFRPVLVHCSFLFMLPGLLEGNPPIQAHLRQQLLGSVSALPISAYPLLVHRFSFIAGMGNLSSSLPQRRSMIQHKMRILPYLGGRKQTCRQDLSGTRSRRHPWPRPPWVPPFR